MARPKEQLDPERLIEAAEASLRAAVESAEGGDWPYPVELMGTPAQPKCLMSFTKWEVKEACAFLVRLGILERPQAGRAA